jgi:hypothetical protein
MENDRVRDPLHEQLHEIERGESASWVVYPPTPLWWAPGFGLWAATLTFVIGRLDGIVQGLAQLCLIAVMGLAIVWDRRRRGTYPSGRAPRELRPAIRRLVLGAVAVGGVAWFIGAQVSLGLAAAVAALGSWAVVAWYEHQYAAVAARVRERLSN